MSEIPAYTTREIIKKVEGCAIFTVPNDVDHSLIDTLTAQVCQYAATHALCGLIVDFSSLKAANNHLIQSLIRLAQAIELLGIPVRLTGIPAGIASALALMDTDIGDIEIRTTIERCLAELRPDRTGRPA